jgi:hypothetical protein
MCSLAILIRYGITGGLPFNTKYSDELSSKQSIRNQLHDTKFLWQNPDLDIVPDVKALLASCFLAKGPDRPPVNQVAVVISETFSDLSYEIYQPPPTQQDQDATTLAQFKSEMMQRVKKVRDAKLNNQKLEVSPLTTMEWSTILDCAEKKYDAVCLYLVGAAVWWRLVHEKDCQKLFNPANSGKFCKPVSLLISLTQE